MTQERAAPSRGGSARSGPHPFELQQGFHTHNSSGIESKIVRTHAPPGRVAGRVQGAVQGELFTTCFFAVPPQFFPRGWARGKGLKGAILNGISGQGTEMYRLWK